MNLSNTYTKLLYLAYFFFAWGIGFTVYSNSQFIEIATSESSVGIIYGISAMLSLFLSSWVTPHLISKFGNKKTIAIALLACFLSLVGISYFVNPIIISISFIFFFASQILIFFNFDIFFEHNTLHEDSAEERGLAISVQHIGRVLGPILAAIVALKFGIQAPYKVTFLLLIIMSILLYIATKDFKDKEYKHSSFIISIKNIITRPDLLKPLTSILLVNIFYALMVAFVPIYLANDIGLGEESLGIIFTIMLTPFIILGFPIGKSIDNGSSGRRTARFGLIIMTIATLAFPFIHTKSLIIWIIVLFVSRVGSVMLEVAGQGIFFKNINEEETELLGIMRDMQPVGYFIASLIAVITLYFGSLVHIFYVIGTILLIGIITTHKKQKYNHENK